MHQPNICRNHDPSKKIPHAYRPTPNPPGMQGSKQEPRPTGWRRPWCATPAKDDTHGHIRTPQLYNYTTDQPTGTNYFKAPAPGTAQARRSQEASVPVTACESCSTCFFKSSHAYRKPTQVGLLAGQGLWPVPWFLGPEIRRLMRRCDRTNPGVSSAQRRGI